MKLTGKLLAAALIPAVAATLILTNDGADKAVDNDIEQTIAGIEIVSERTENTEVFETNVPGKRVMRVYSRPVHYRDKETGRLEKYDFAERDVDESVKGDSRRKHDKYVKIGNHGMGWMKGKRHDYRFNHESGYYVQYRLLTTSKGMAVETETNRDGVKQTYTMSDTTWTGRLRWTLETDAAKTVNGAEVVYTDSTGAFLFRTSSPVAWDADGKDVPVTVTVHGDTLTYDADVEGVTWPVTVDPTTNVTAGNEGLLYHSNADFATGRNATTATSVLTDRITVGMLYSGGNYNYYRSSLSFAMPDIDVDSIQVSLYVYGKTDNSTTDFEIYANTSTPSATLATGDYNDFDGWQSSGAYNGVVLNNTWSSSSISVEGWNTIAFNAAGNDTAFARINSTLSVMLISKEDYANSAPTQSEYVVFYSSETSGKEPYLAITYTAKMNAPIDFTLTLPADADSTTQLYATVTPNHSADIDSFYVQTSAGAWVQTFPTKTATAMTLTGLTPATEYRLKVRADSTDAHGESNLDTLTTRASKPTAVTISGHDKDRAAITWNANGNPDSTMYAIAVHNATDDSLYYWTGSGLSTTATWKTRPAWGVPETVTNLVEGNDYYLGVKARNGDNLETELVVGTGFHAAEMTQDSDPLPFSAFYTSQVTSAVYDSARVEQNADSIATAAAEKLGQSAAKMIARMTIDIQIPAGVGVPTFSGFQLHLRGKANYSTTDFLIRGSYGGWTSEQTSERYYTWPGYTQTMSPYGLINQMWEDYNTSGFVIGDNVLVANSTGVGLVNEWKGTTAKLYLISSRDISATSPSGNEYVEFHHESPDSSYAIYQYEYVEAVPYGVTATPLSSTEIAVTWNDSTLTNTGFLIVDGSTGVAYSDTLAHDAEADTLTGLTPNLLLSLKVKVVGGTMDGSLSSAVSVATYPNPFAAAPDTSGQTQTTITVTADLTGWDNPSYTEFAYYFITSAGDTLWVDRTATPDTLKAGLGINDSWGWGDYVEWGGPLGTEVTGLDAGRTYTVGTMTRGVDTGDEYYEYLLDAPLTEAAVNLGDELITNGDFSAWSGDADPNNTPTGWILANNDADNYFQDAVNAARMVSPDSNLALNFRSILVSNKTYISSVNITDHVKGYISLFVYSLDGARGNSAGVFTKITRANGRDFYVRNAYPTYYSGPVDTEATFTDVSVREYWLSDLSPNARHLSPDVEPTWNTLASGLKVMNFNGTTDLIDTGSDFIGTKAVTVEAWIRPESWGEGSNGTVISNNKAWMYVSSANTVLRFTSDGGSTIAESGAITLNNWYHVVVTRAADGTVNIYINGVLSGSANQASGTPEAGSTNVFIGNRSAADFTFDGDISMVRVYDGVLTVDEIEDIYDSVKAWYGL